MSSASISYRCTACGTKVVASGASLVCSECSADYPIVNGVPDFVGGSDGWDFGSTRQQLDLLEAARKLGWKQAIEHVYKNPTQAAWLTDRSRGRACRLTDLMPEGRALDVGCGWGVLSLFLSEMCSEVHSIDITSAALEFLSVRSAEEGISHLHPARVDLMRANPFSEESFDLVVLNGVLEWIPEYHSGNPSTVQRRFLHRCLSLLRPGGQLLLGIENRTGFPYFMGYPEEHSRLPWVSLLPRVLADGWSRAKRGRDYRTYTHTPARLQALVTSVGFRNLSLHFPWKSYRAPEEVFSKGQDLEIWEALSAALRERLPVAAARSLQALPHAALRRLTVRAFTSLLAPSLYLIARRPQAEV